MLLPIFNICSGVSNLVVFYVIIFACFFQILVYIFYIKFKYNNINILVYLFSNKLNYIITCFLNLSFIPNKIQLLVESIIVEFINLFKNLINTNYIFLFFYSILTTILFILLSNLIGLIPYTFTITAQIFITLNLSFLLFLLFNYVRQKCDSEKLLRQSCCCVCRDSRVPRNNEVARATVDK